MWGTWMVYLSNSWNLTLKSCAFQHKFMKHRLKNMLKTKRSKPVTLSASKGWLRLGLPNTVTWGKDTSFSVSPYNGMFYSQSASCFQRIMLSDKVKHLCYNVKRKKYQDKVSHKAGFQIWKKQFGHRQEPIVFLNQWTIQGVLFVMIYRHGTPTLSF